MTLSELVEAVFAPDGALARAIPDFEARSGQTEMAAAVAQNAPKDERAEEWHY